MVQIVRMLMVAGVTLWAAGLAQAQSNYPDRPVRPRDSP